MFSDAAWFQLQILVNQRFPKDLEVEKMELLTSNELRQKFSTPGNYSVTIFLVLVGDMSLTHVNFLKINQKDEEIWHDQQEYKYIGSDFLV